MSWVCLPRALNLKIVQSVEITQLSFADDGAALPDPVESETEALQPAAAGRMVRMRFGEDADQSVVTLQLGQGAFDHAVKHHRTGSQK